MHTHTHTQCNETIIHHRIFKKLQPPFSIEIYMCVHVYISVTWPSDYPSKNLSDRIKLKA